MMNKLHIDYSPMIARASLEKKFKMHREFISRIEKMSACYLCPLAALCDGKTITTTGNSIMADYEVTRASAVIQFLRKQYAIPIQRRLIYTITVTGSSAKQALFFISKEDLAALKNNPNSITKLHDAQMKITSELKAKKTINTLVTKFGSSWVEACLEEIKNRK